MGKDIFKKMNSQKYTVYMVKCKDESLYTGYTTNLKNRIEQHNNSKKAARYTKSRRPVKLVYQEIYNTKSKAMKREAEIKKLSRNAKLVLTKTRKK